MANQNTIAIEIVVDDKGTATIKSFGSATVSELKKAETAGSSLGAGFAKTWAGIAAGAAGAIYVFQQIKGAVEAPIKAYMEQEDAIMKMAVAMKNQGDYTRETLKDLEDFSAQMQKTSTAGDEMALSMMANLKTYGMTNAEVKAATQTAIDFAAAKKNEGLTITTASELIGKAYAGNTATLSRYGIVIQEGLSGSEKFAAVMDQLNQRFGGAAQAEIMTYAGQWKQLQNEWGDIQELLGFGLLKAIEGLLFTAGLLTTTFMTAGSAILGIFRLITAPITLLLEGFSKLAELAGLTRTADALHSIATATQEAQENINSAKEGVIAWTAKQYDAMVATDNVTAAIDKMGNAGKRTQAIDEEAVAAAKKAAEARKKLNEDITEAIRKSGVEIEGIGKSQYEQDIIRINAEAEKYKTAGADRVLVAKYVATETIAAEKKEAEELKKIRDKSNEDFLLAQEKMTLDEGKEMNERFFAEKKAAEEYKKLMANEYEFAATENERAINKIIADAKEKEEILKKLASEGKVDATKLATDLITINANKDRAILEKETENARKIADLNYNLIRDIAGYEKVGYDARIIQIAAQAEAYRVAGGDTVRIAEWVRDQTALAYIEMGRKSDDWTDGVEAGLLEITRAHTTWGSTAYELTKKMSDNSATAFGSNFRDIVKGDFTNLGEAWGTLWDNALIKLGEDIGKMIIEAAAKDIILLFKSEWTAGGSNVLGIIDKVLGLGLNLLGGGGDWGGTGAPGELDYAGGRVGDGNAFGKPIPGNARYAGDHPGNDTVPIWASPGEVVIRRTSVNPDTAEILDYINKFGQPPQYAFGGRVMNAVTDTPGRGYWGFSDLVSIATGGLSDVFGITKGGLGQDIFLPFISTFEALQAGSGWADYIDALFDPVTGPGINNLLKGSGRYINEVAPWFGQLVDMVAPIVGAVVGGIYGGPGGAAGGAAAGSGFASKFNNYPNEDALIKAGISAAAAYFAAPASGGIDAAAQAATTAAEDAALGAAMQGLDSAAQQAAWEAAYTASINQTFAQVITDAGLGSIKSYVQKWVINEALGAILDNPEQGQMKMTYEGAQDNGLLSSLSGLMGEIAPRSDSFAFSARDGLDYVPRDNFRINAHEGEAVLNEQDARTWRGGADSPELLAEIRLLRAEVRAVAASSDKFARLAARWDGDGLPETRTV